MQLSFAVDNSSPIPLYKQIARALELSIRNGEFIAGRTLPSSRSVAEDLGVSRLTVSKAYELLNRQGYLVTSSRGKTYVNRSAPLEELNFSPDQVEAVGPDYLSSYGNQLLSSFTEGSSAQLSDSVLTPSELLPAKKWRDCLRKAAGSEDLNFADSSFDCFGSMALRRQLRQYLSRVRQVRCDTEQIVILPSAEGGLNLLSRILLDSGQQVAVEDPCFPGIRKSLNLNGASLLPIAVDDEGLMVERLRECAEPPKLVYVTPAHQDTTGVKMSERRRIDFCEWVANSGVLVIEDDFDSEFSVGTDRMAALHARLPATQAIYQCNFWKSLFPLIRISVIVIPKWLIPVFRTALNALHSPVSHLEQEALAIFMERGGLDRHIRTCRDLYTARRVNLIFNLTRHLGKAVAIGANSGGTNLLINFDESLDSKQIERASILSGIKLDAQSEHYFLTKRPANLYSVCLSSIDESLIASRVSDFSQVLMADVPEFNQFFSHLRPVVSNCEMKLRTFLSRC